MWWRTGKIVLACTLGLSLASAPLRAEDVEQDPILIAPPKPERKSPPRPKPLQPQAPIPDAATPKPPPPVEPRYPGPFEGPQRIDLRPGPDFVAPPPQRERSEHERVSDKLDTYLRLMRCRDRVRSGQVDQAWFDLADRMEHYFQPDFDLIADPRVSEVSGEWLRDTTWRFLHGWYQEVQKQRTDPFARPPRVMGDEAAESVTRIMDMQREAIQQGSWGNTVVSLVEVRFGQDGRAEAKLLESSGHPAYDRAALAGVHQALKSDWGDAAPPGPARSIYALTSNYTILPPLPVVGFTFDIMLGHFDPIYPLKKMVSSKAVLLAVYRPEEDGGKAPWGGAEDGASDPAARKSGGPTDP